MVEEEKKEPGFTIFKEIALMFTMMKPETVGAVVKACCRLFLYGEIAELDGEAQEAYTLIADSMARQHEKYVQTCEQNRKNINNRWHKGE